MIRKEPNALILISTEDHLSFLTLLKAANVKTSGYLEFSATCTTCRKDETVMECPHMKGYHSSVFAENRAVKLKELYTITNQTDIMRTELFSSGTDTSQKRFQPHLIDAFIKGRPDEELPYLDPKSTVVIGVDPGGGGRSDHIYTALVPGRQGRPVLVGMGKYELSQDIDYKIKEATYDFIMRIRKRFPEAEIWVACEGAPPSCGNDVFSIVNQFDASVKFLCTKQRGGQIYNYGIYPAPLTKTQYISDLATMFHSHVLSVARDIVAVCDTPMRLNGITYGPGQADSYLLTLLSIQLKDFELEPSGRETGKNVGMRKDDAVLSLVWGCGAMKEYAAGNLDFRPKVQNEQYKRKWQEAFQD